MSAPTFRSAIRDAAGRLACVTATPAFEAEILLGAVCAVSRAGILAYPERPLTHTQAAQFDAAVSRRLQGEPVAYITGFKEFYSLSLAVTPAVLVPRPETELLVDICLNLAAGRAGPAPGPAIVDLGTGTGAIALALKAQLPDATVTAVEFNTAAIDVVHRNAAALGLDVAIVRSCWFDAVGAGRFDLIVSNPPYVRSGDPHFDGALAHEPRTALDGGRDGLDCYRAIFTASARRLHSGGRLVLEHGYDQRRALTELAAEAGYAVVEVRDDLAGLPRAMVLKADRR